MAVFDRLPVLSLRQMAMTKVAITVCLDPEILDFVKDYGCASFVFPSKETHLYLNAKCPVEENWMWKDIMVEKIKSKFSYLHRTRRNATETDDCEPKNNVLPFANWEELVEERISSFLLPQLLQHELLDVVRSVSIEIDKWIKDHTKDWRLSPVLARCVQYDFQWNLHGKIDRGRTARKLIFNEKLDIEDRYLFAILYSLVDKMANREQVPHEIVEKYLNIYENGWSTLIGNVEFEYISRHKCFINMSSDIKCVFLTSLLMEECAQYEDFIFYISHMRDEEKKRVFKSCFFYILLPLLDWPLQCEFLKAAEHLLPYFTESYFLLMLDLIIYERIMMRRKDFNYIDLLKGFWSLSPSSLKESIKTHSIYEPLMFIVNFPVGEMFPNQQLLEMYTCSDLRFTSCGAKYGLMRQKMPIDVIKCYSQSTFGTFPAITFIHLFIFDKDSKTKHDQSRVPVRRE
ncbi:uncharacterized protein TNCT_238111 [Trichonephila clavata]|uniref:Uncharacterized protein n=1 Tax=Trichonephila clavata TaxID=2740835 RepID=A0A8X6GB74_TRICU|nr:uncharacterized protein TNCT_238111 [Trichonephila clavata]